MTSQESESESESEIRTEYTFVKGDFSYLQCPQEISMTKNAYDAITLCELWLWLKTFEPESTGFTYCNHPNIYLIGDKMNTLSNPPSHSGTSFGIIMRRMQYIAKHGEEQFFSKMIE